VPELLQCYCFGKVKVICSEYSEDVSVILVSEMIYCVSRGMLNRAH